MTSAFIATLLGLGLHAAPAQAQLSRTAVSALRGNDANACDFAAPCRTFQRAHDQTNDQGEITVLDPGGYGSLVITKSISLVNDGVGEASILVSGGATGITINGNAGAYVNLRGITIQGIGFGGSTGLVFNSGFALTITNCVVRNHTGNGIVFQPMGTGVRRLAVSSTLVADNGQNGIWVHPIGGDPNDMSAHFSHVLALNNSLDGILVDGAAGSDGSTVGNIISTVADSVAAANGRGGFAATNIGLVTVNMMVSRSVAASNGTGVRSIGTLGVGPAVRVGQSSLTGNASTWVISGSAFLMSYGDNNVDVNGDGSPGAPNGIIGKK